MPEIKRSIPFGEKTGIQKAQLKTVKKPVKKGAERPDEKVKKREKILLTNQGTANIIIYALAKETRFAAIKQYMKSQH